MAVVSRNTVSVIIRTYTESRWSLFKAAVESLNNQTRSPDQIVLVVDHNPPLAKQVRETFPYAHVVENNLAQGSGGAWNCGIAAASGDIVAFLDDDAVAAPDWVDQLCVSYHDPDVMGVGGAIIPMWQNTRPGWFPPEFDWVVGCTYVGLPKTTSAVRNLIGCNMSFRREILSSIAGFRSEIGHKNGRPIGGDETELCIRLGQRWPDKRLLHHPRAIVHHHVPSSRSTWSYFRHRCYCEGQSKALVAKFVGPKDGLETERHYITRTLPLGVARGVATALRGHSDGIMQAGAIIGGLSVTVAGYIVAKASAYSRHVLPSLTGTKNANI